jgi:hypothetical protein
MDRGTFLFVLGVCLGYCVIQAVTYLQQHYLWAFFY